MTDLNPFSIAPWIPAAFIAAAILAEGLIRYTRKDTK